MIVIPFSTGLSCGKTNTTKIIFEKVVQKCKKYQKQYRKDQQTNKSFDKFYRRNLQDNLMKKNEYESLCKIFTKYLDETKTEFFCKYEHKKKNEFFQ